LDSQGHAIALLSLLGLIAEADLSPLDGGANRSFETLKLTIRVIVADYAEL
jgi:hypothetical protein